METTLYQGDCLDRMKEIADGSVDCILADLPYGHTNARWDSTIPLEPLWEEYNRIIKPTGAICLFGSEPFSSYLRMSNIKYYKYDWIWEKSRGTGFLHAKNAPLKAHEIISVFSHGSINHPPKTDRRMEYNPQFSPGKPWTRKMLHQNIGELFHTGASTESFVGQTKGSAGATRYPRSILKFPFHNVGNYHPTQKPVPLLEYLIRTYTNPGETVLDNVMGSGSCGVAAVNTGRNFIGIELDPGYFQIAQERIQAAQEAAKCT